MHIKSIAPGFSRAFLGAACAGVLLNSTAEALTCSGVYFPPKGQSTSYQKKKTASAVGLSSGIVTDLKNTILAGRWAVWRHGYLVHNQGAFNTKTEIKSARKTFHAATIGALIRQGKIDSIHQPLTDWDAGVAGGPGNCHLDATLGHAMTQTTAFDESQLCPGELWAYSDANPPVINRVAARAWRGTNATDYTSNYKEVIGGALLDRIGASGWSTSVESDGIRLSMDLEDLGRFGLLMANGGRWNGTVIVPEWFVVELSTKQTYGIPPNFDNANDGHTGLTEEDFPAGSPYGYFTWVNTEQDLFPEADPTWAEARGANGNILLWDGTSGVVMAILASSDKFSPAETRPGWPLEVTPVVNVLQASIIGPNPLVSCE